MIDYIFDDALCAKLFRRRREIIGGTDGGVQSEGNANASSVIYSYLERYTKCEEYQMVVTVVKDIVSARFFRWVHRLPVVSNFSREVLS